MVLTMILGDENQFFSTEEVSQFLDHMAERYRSKDFRIYLTFVEKESGWKLNILATDALLRQVEADWTLRQVPR